MSLKARLGFFDTTAVVVSLVVGIGIFRTPSYIASATGSIPLYIIAWLFGSLVSLLGALTFAEIGSRYPRPGSFYKVVAVVYHPMPALMLNWMNVLIITGAGLAAIAMIGAEYSARLLPASLLMSDDQLWMVAFLIALAMIAVNMLGIRPGGRLLSALTVLKILLVLLLSGAAFFVAPSLRPLAAPDAGSTPGWGLGAIGAALVAVFYTYDGYQATINLGGDVKEGKRKLPRAILFGFGIIFLLYLLMNTAYLHVLGIEGLSNHPQVAGELAHRSLGPAADKIVSLVVIVSCLGILNVTLMHVPRAMYAMACDGLLPVFFRKVNDSTQAQQPALLFIGGMILLSLVLFETFERLMSFVTFFNSLNLAIVASTVFGLRRRSNAESDVFRTPLYPFIPGLFIVILLGVCAYLLFQATIDSLIGLGFFLLGAPLYLLMKRYSSADVNGPGEED